MSGQKFEVHGLPVEFYFEEEADSGVLLLRLRTPVTKFNKSKGYIVATFYRDGTSGWLHNNGYFAAAKEDGDPKAFISPEDYKMIMAEKRWYWSKLAMGEINEDGEQVDKGIAH